MSGSIVVCYSQSRLYRGRAVSVAGADLPACGIYDEGAAIVAEVPFVLDNTPVRVFRAASVKGHCTPLINGVRSTRHGLGPLVRWFLHPLPGHLDAGVAPMLVVFHLHPVLTLVDLAFCLDPA